jgi:hypothetical protein
LSGNGGCWRWRKERMPKLEFWRWWTLEFRIRDEADVVVFYYANVYVSLYYVFTT